MTMPSVSLPVRLTTACAGLVMVATPVGLAPPATSLAPTAAKATTVTAKSNTFESKVMKRINKLRSARGMKRVKMTKCPDTYAERGARTNARNGSLAHQDLSPVMTSCRAKWAGEVIAAGDRLGVRGTVRMWMRSSGHKAIIMKRSIRRIGVGAFARGNGKVFVTAVAGR